MLKIRLFAAGTAALCLCSSAALAAATATPALTLPRVVEIALENAPEGRLASTRIAEE